MDKNIKDSGTPLKLVFGIVVVSIVVVGIIFVSLNQKSKQVQVENDKMMTESDTVMSNSDKMINGNSVKTETMMSDGSNSSMMEKGSYEDYSPEKVSGMKVGDKVVLFFKASWCPTCNAFDKDVLVNIGNIPAGVHILKVDYDTATDLKVKYGITYQHTFVEVGADGVQKLKWSGSMTLADLISHIK